MKRNFTCLFEIIRNKFIEQQSGKSITMKALAKFLGHEHDGKVTAWKKGQWPSAEDITIIHDKLGFNYRWLLLGEGEPLAKDPTAQEITNFAELKRENDLLKAELSEEISFSRKLSKQNAELYDKCRALEEKLSFLEETKLGAPLPTDAPGSQAGKNLNMLNDESKKQ
ncbi:MAG: hypothetical protein OSJ28_10525 [Desulfovibrio sp.]|jgi:hypothetical protein|nr:hypothetical protein [Desulfovibrio sp.]